MFSKQKCSILRTEEEDSAVTCDTEDTQQCPFKCHNCNYWYDGDCKLLGGESYWYGFCDGFTPRNQLIPKESEV